jgi:hypothetical protein
MLPNAALYRFTAGFDFAACRSFFRFSFSFFAISPPDILQLLPPAGRRRQSTEGYADSGRFPPCAAAAFTASAAALICLPHCHRQLSCHASRRATRYAPRCQARFAR